VTSSDFALVLVAEPASGQWHHRGVGELEHEESPDEHEERPIPRNRMYPVRFPRLLTAPRRSGAGVIDLDCADSSQRTDGRNAKRSGDEKHRPLLRQMREPAHQPHGDSISKGIVTLVATEAPAESAVTHEAEANGRERGV
jgi:hypothetical protein